MEAHVCSDVGHLLTARNDELFLGPIWGQLSLLRVIY